MPKAELFSSASGSGAVLEAAGRVGAGLQLEEQLGKRRNTFTETMTSQRRAGRERT